MASASSSLGSMVGPVVGDPASSAKPRDSLHDWMIAGIVVLAVVALIVATRKGA